MREYRLVDSPPYTIDPGVLGRFDQRRTAFALDWRASREEPDVLGAARHAPRTDARARPPAEVIARVGRFVHDHFERCFQGEHAAIDPPAAPARDPLDNAGIVKHAAGQFGADLVGICEVNRAWLYSHDYEGGPVELPETHRWAVVMATAMDAGDIRTSPGPAATMATHLGYMRMAIHAHCLRRFIRELGHGAIACCNDTALSIPLAIDAGLGEMGRNGCLITPRFGPCVRICKVFTDMPLAADGPVELGAAEACGTCRLCAEACPVGAIGDAPDPSFDTVCPANNPGVRRYPVDAVKCLAFWRRSGQNCSTCIAACPFTNDG